MNKKLKKFKITNLIICFALIISISFGFQSNAAGFSFYASRNQGVLKTETKELSCKNMSQNIKIKYQVSASYSYDINSGAINGGTNPVLKYCEAIKLPSNEASVYEYILDTRDVTTYKPIIAKNGSSITYQISFHVYVHEKIAYIEENVYDYGIVTYKFTEKAK